MPFVKDALHLDGPARQIPSEAGLLGCLTKYARVEEGGKKKVDAYISKTTKIKKPLHEEDRKVILTHEALVL